MQFYIEHGVCKHHIKTLKLQLLLLVFHTEGAENILPLIEHNLIFLQNNSAIAPPYIELKFLSWGGVINRAFFPGRDWGWGKTLGGWSFLLQTLRLFSFPVSSTFPNKISQNFPPAASSNHWGRETGNTTPQCPQTQAPGKKFLVMDGTYLYYWYGGYSSVKQKTKECVLCAHKKNT